MVTKRNQMRPSANKSTRRRQRRRMVALEPDMDSRLEALASRLGTNVNCQIQIAVSKHLDAADEEELQRKRLDSPKKK